MPEPTLSDLADRIDDLVRVVSRQAATLGELGGAAGSAAQSDRPQPDLPLLVELHALRADAMACAGTARTRREAAAFTAIAAGLERLLAGRGGRLVAPGRGEAFSGTAMEAVEVVPTDDPARDRTVADLLVAGLAVGERSVRPARVTAFRHRPG